MALPGMKDERFATMSLGTDGPSTIQNFKAEHYKSLKLGPAAGRPTNLVRDIEGAQPAPLYKYTEKPSFYDPYDIRGTRSNKLIRDTNAIDYTLKLDDIEGAQPHPHTFKTNRVVDPLMPAYKLPSTKPADNFEPKFIRDSHSVSDISGTKSRPLYPWPQRENQKCNDIEGAQAGWRPRHERARLEAPPSNGQYDVRDINNIGFKSTRTVCPLKPEYRINGMIIRDDPRYTEPKPLPAPSNHDFFSLKTDDIEGAAPGWVPPHECRPPKEIRKHFRNTNFVGDIPGAQADTVKHAIRTERVVNPLNPVYDSLDGERLKPPMTPNILNGDPSKFGLNQPDSYKDMKSDEFVPPISSRSNNNNNETIMNNNTIDYYEHKSAREEPVIQEHSEFISPKVPAVNIAAMHQTKDEKILALEQELQRLKSTRQAGASSFRSNPTSSRLEPNMSASAFVASARSSNNMPMSATNRIPTSRISSRSGGLAVSRAPSDSLVSSARPRPSPSFTLKSGNNTARSTRASSRREDTALAAEIASVRDL